MTLTRARRGDRAAICALVTHYQGLVFGYLGRLYMAGPADPRVEDAAQETFVRVLEALHRFDPEGPARLSTWVLRIATNLAIDDIRRRATARRKAPPPEIPDVPPASAITASVYRAVAALSPDMRAAFLLRELCDFTYREVADALGIETGTAKSRVARARASLRRALEEPS